MSTARAGLALLALALLAGCKSECGSSIYPDYPEMRVREATANTHMETGPPLPYTETATGSGRTVVLGRKVGLRATFFDAEGRQIGDHLAAVLFPRFDRERFGHLAYGIDSGEMPVYFEPILGGMQVGTKRRFTMPRHTYPVPWRIRSIGASETVEIPGDGPVTVDLEVLSICKPKICLVTTWSIPAMRNQRIVERSCR